MLPTHACDGRVIPSGTAPPEPYHCGVPRQPVGVGIDVGSTNTKVVAATAAQLVAVRSHPTPNQPDDLVATVFRMIRDVVAEAPSPPVAVGVSSMAETGWAIGDSGPLTQLLRWDAARDPKPMAKLESRIGADQWFAATGVRPGPKPMLGALLDLRLNQPDTFKSMRRWSGVADGIHLALTGSLRTDHTLASRSLAYRLLPVGTDLERTFDAELLGLVGVEPGQLPTVGLPGDPLDRVSAEASSATDLTAGTPVVVAGHDHQVAAWASGVRSPGDVANSVGTAEAVLALVSALDDRVPLRHQGMSLVRAIDGATEAVLAGTPSSGAFLQWLADLLTEGDVQVLLSDTHGELPSPGFWLPYPSGRQAPQPDPSAQAKHFGPFGAPGIEALEAVCLQSAWLLERVGELAGTPTARMTVIGEPVRRNPLWAQLKATLTATPIRTVSVEQPVAFGAALLAMVRAYAASDDVRLPAEWVGPLPLVTEYRHKLQEFINAALAGHRNDFNGPSGVPIA